MIMMGVVMIGAADIMQAVIVACLGKLLGSSRTLCLGQRGSPLSLWSTIPTPVLLPICGRVPSQPQAAVYAYRAYSTL